MNQLARFSLLIVCFTICNAAHLSAWNSFKTTHEKVYTTPNEEASRFAIFMDNLQMIEKHNKQYEAGLKSYKMGMNKMGDMTAAEINARMNGYKSPSSLPRFTGRKFSAPSIVDLPKSIDWREKGYVTNVKDQGFCGSCWAFSATGSLEGQHFNRTGELVELSEQNLLDCDVRGEDAGCNGGFMDGAFEFVKTNHGIDTESAYPYEARNANCRFKKDFVGATDIGYVDIESGSERDLEIALATVGPVSVAIDASSMSFALYQEGVYDELDCGSSPDSLNHGVLAVGYGVTEKGKKYYIVKNSWGTAFGDKGYILMARRKNNHCGIATDASYPIA